MSSNSDIKQVSYLCSQCGQTRKLNIDRDVHLQRRELEVNGLASYIDVHADKGGTSRHGIKIFIDKNFHVRTNNVLKIKSVAPKTGAIPMPGFKTREISTKYDWNSWLDLELEIKTENLKFVLELDRELEQNQTTSKITAESELGSVICSIDALTDDPSAETLLNIEGWIKSLVNSLELASAIHVDLIPEILRYIDHHGHRRITYTDEIIVSILIDKSSILIPDQKTMKMIAKYGPAMSLIGLNPEQLSKIADKLCEYDQFSMIDIREILESELEVESELEEEFIVLALFYLISLDAFDYKLSYLQQTVKSN